VRAPAAEDVDWEDLSPEGTWIAANIALPISEGFTYDEVAAQLGIPKRHIRRALNELAEEIRETISTT
jgi:hypothetical protein